MGGRRSRFLNRLTALKVQRLKKPSYHADGGGLYLQISGTGTKSWVFVFHSPLYERRREKGLGSLHDVFLAEARVKAAECRKLLDQGIDPIEASKAKLAQARLTAARSMTFSACAAAYIEAHRNGWSNAKHAAQWESTIKAYADPVFGKLPVADVDTHLVMRVLEPIWNKIPETASRLRGRIESVLDWATVRGLRAGDNPARWRGHLDKLLPKRSRAHAVKHHPALPYREMGSFMAALRKQEGIAARALEFLILSAARTGEVIGAVWPEFDMEQKLLWTIPPQRMKSKREHRVPLSPRALEILKVMRRGQQSEFVFPGGRPDKPLSIVAMWQLLKRLNRPGLTIHGFRSTISDWCAERTNYPREVAEATLAHAQGDKVEAAYRRSDLLVRRRHMLAEWAKYCENSSGAGKVLSLSKRSNTAT